MRASLPCFTTWHIIEAVAAFAIACAAVSFPPAAPAIFGFLGASNVYFIARVFAADPVSPAAFGFGVGAAIGIFFYYGAYPSAWSARYAVANTIIPSMVFTLVVLGIHHVRHRPSQQSLREETHEPDFSDKC